MSLNIFKYGRVSVHAYLGSVSLGWRYTPASAKVACFEDQRILTVHSRVDAYKDNRNVKSYPANNINSYRRC